MTKVQKIIPAITMLDKRITNVHCTEIGCNSVFKSKSNLSMHLLRHHKKEMLQPVDKEVKMEYHCPIENCMYNISREQFFSKFKLVKQHYLKVHCSKDVICTKCNKTFTTAVNIKEHEKYCGIDFYCLSCSNKYTTYEALRTHTKRKGHNFKEKKAYLPPISIVSEKTAILYTTTGRLILPKIGLKSTNEIGIQTDLNCCKQKRILLRKRSISSQTNEHRLKTIETQTSGDHILKRAMEQADIPLLITKRMNNQDMHTQTFTKTAEKATEPLLTRNTLLLNSNATYLDNSNCYSLTVDADLEDVWNDSGTQTSPVQNGTHTFDNNTQSQRNNNYLASNCFMGNYEVDQEVINENKFCNIETQTDINSLFNENSFYHLPFSNMCTQTANTTLLDLELNDIETQTAWPVYRDDYLVSTETQTSSFVTEFNHTETQTDLGLSPIDVS